MTNLHTSLHMTHRIPSRPLARLEAAVHRKLFNFACAMLLAFVPMAASAAGHVCAWRVDPPRPNFPSVLLDRLDYADSTQAAACMFASRHQVFTDASDCVQARVDKVVRCVAVPTDPVIDKIERNPTRSGGIEGAVGPRKSYRCKLLQSRTSPWEPVEASS